MTAPRSNAAKPAKPKTAAARRRTRNATPPAAATAAAMFDVTAAATSTPLEGTIVRVELSAITLAANPRRTMTDEGLERLAVSLMRNGQYVPAIGRRTGDQVVIYEGQRRVRAAELSQKLAGTADYEHLQPVAALLVMLLDYDPTPADVTRIQAQVNSLREDLTFVDQAAQFADCWEARAGAAENDRVILVAEDLGIGAAAARNFLRLRALPQQIAGRVARRPAGSDLSIRLALQIADIHAASPALAASVARHVSSPELHDQALKNVAGFVHRTIVADKDVYAVRLDVGALLDAAAEIGRARLFLNAAEHTEQLRSTFTARAAEPAEGETAKPVDVEDAVAKLAAEAGGVALKIRVDETLRDRAANTGCAYVNDRGRDYAAGVWVTDPTFLIDHVVEILDASAHTAAHDERYFHSSAATNADLNAEKDAEKARRAAARATREQAVGSNLGLGADITAALMDPSDDQLNGLRDLICLLICQTFPDVVAYGAGWTSRDNQGFVGDSERLTPLPAADIVVNEVARALGQRDPLRGIAQLMASFSAAFVLNPDGTTRATALGADRIQRRLRDVVPGGAGDLRAAMWQFMRPMMSQNLQDLHRDDFVADPLIDGSVDLEARRAPTDLTDLDLGDDDAEV